MIYGTTCTLKVCHVIRIQALKQEIETLEAEIDPKESDPKRMTLLQDKQQELAKTEYLVNREVSLLRGKNSKEGKS